MRKTIIAGNWKMNKLSLEAIDLVNALKRRLHDVSDVDIVVCPVFTALSDVRDVLNETNIRLGAQNCYWENSGAFTGEISASMLKDLSVEFVIVGHSERRQYFGETNESVNKKLKAVQENSMTPIVCVGESLEERETNKTFDVIKKQCRESLADICLDKFESMIIAYEPVWAIGTGKTATSEQAQEVHAFIRQQLSEIANSKVADSVRIQYGGSVKPENISDLIAQPDIDGALVGGASLKEDSFSAIVKNCSGLMAK